MVVKRGFFVAMLLMGSMVAVSCLAQAQATIDFTAVPNPAACGQQITFTAVVTEGDPSWFVLYEWDFNQDGTYEAAGRVVQFAFASAGTKPVTLRGKDDRGGYHSVTKNLTVVNNPPTACFTYSPTYPSAGEPVAFDGSCSTDTDGTIATYSWAFSDGETAAGRTVRHAFATAGTRSATLTVTDNGGATDSEIRSVAVQCVAPVADFTYSPSSPTVHDEIAFQDLSTDPDGGTILTWSWTFGDGATSTLKNPRHQYANGGTYTVTLTIRDNCELTDTKSLSIAVGGPAAAFSYAPINPTTQDTVQFFDGSTTVGGDIASWSWTFGDGAVSAAQNPSHRFASPGVYNVRLTITTDRGATSSTSRALTVSNAPPTATFTFSPSSPKMGEMVTFSAAGSGDPDGSVVMYEWDFNEDGITDATGASVTHAFSIVGARPVTLCVTDNLGAKSRVTRVVPVQATPPSASFTFTPAEPYTGQVVTFNASASSDPDGTIILYEWDFDANGTPDATGMSVTRSFPSPGVYPVTLTVTDNDLAVDAETKGVPVDVGGTSGDNQIPVAAFTFSTQSGSEVRLNEVVTFRADGSSDPDGSIVAYEWDFDRDGHFDATGKVVTHVFHDGGARIVQLRVTDDDGAHGYKTRVVSVEFVRPRADFSWSPRQPEVGDVVTFDGSKSKDDDGTVQFYEWDFDNDGKTDATGMTANHAFSVGGSQPVTLVVTDSDGITDLITQRVQVTVNAPPVAAFDVQTPLASRVCNSAITFTDRSTDTDGRVTQWLWNFGDSGTSAIQTPSHTYSCTGVQSYTVTLTVTDDGGKTGTTSQLLTLAAPPVVVDFTWSPVQPDAGAAVTFTPIVPNGAVVTSWAWTFGDGGTSTIQTPSHPYASQGTYGVSLEVRLADGQSARSPSHSVVVDGGPGPDPYAYPNPASRNATIVLNLPAGATDVVLRIFDLAGRVVVNQDVDAGAATYRWGLTSDDGEDVPNGLYFILVTAVDADGSAWRSAVFKLLVVR